MRALVRLLSFVAIFAFAGALRADEERFGELVMEATSAFGKGEFEKAIELAEQAYVIRKDPRLLYNMARAHEALGNLELAIDHYRRYLEADPESKNKDVVNGRILALETTVVERLRLEGERLEAKGERSPAVAAYRRYLERAPRARDRAEIERRIAELERPHPKARKSAAPAGRRTRPNLWPWITIGAGAAVVGAGAVFAVLSRGKYDDAEAARDGESAIALQEDGDRYTDFANVGFVAGGVILAGGVTWLLVSPSVSESSALSLGVGPSRLRLEGRF